eukprot:SAG31_NODE_220_length_19925_cov_3.630939_2_plen_290_part_00
MAWTTSGILFTGLQKTQSHLFKLGNFDPAAVLAGSASPPGYKQLSPTGSILMGVSVSIDGGIVAAVASSSTALPEIIIAKLTGGAWVASTTITNSTQQIADWGEIGRREVISWISKDGTEIEGILIKPADFDPNAATFKPRPLMCIIHGGPTGVDTPTMDDRPYYPIQLWLAKGALCLKVNYRGSAGYGEAFRRLNYRNLGVGDAWDVLSGVEMLSAKGWIDTSRCGCMGWSQGGYISAFLSTNTNKFAAYSVGAGISNWATYYCTWADSLFLLSMCIAADNATVGIAS